MHCWVGVRLSRVGPVDAGGGGWTRIASGAAGACGRRWAGRRRRVRGRGSSPSGAVQDELEPAANTGYSLFPLLGHCHTTASHISPCSMPDSSPFDASVPPYSFIRIDKFTKPASTTALHLLTHCHSDHLSGLGAKTFNSIALCSKDTRRIVLNLETYKNRALYAAALLEEKDKHKPYRNLRVRPGKNDGRSRDLLVCLLQSCICQLTSADSTAFRCAICF
jgi:hypothetical protein